MPGFERIDRCAVRRVTASAEAQAALDSATRTKLGPVVESVRLTPLGDRVFHLGLRDAPVPDVPPDTEADAVSAARAAIARYGSAFGDVADQLGRARLHAFRSRTGRIEWRVSGGIAGRAPQEQVHVELARSGAPLRIIVKMLPPEPPPGVICAQPGLALDDPRIRRAIAGATVRDWPPMQAAPDEIRFDEADIGAIRTNVVELDRGVIRRVIEVELKDRMWTARLDPDTAALIGIQANFVY